MQSVNVSSLRAKDKLITDQTESGDRFHLTEKISAGSNKDGHNLLFKSGNSWELCEELTLAAWHVQMLNLIILTQMPQPLNYPATYLEDL